MKNPTEEKFFKRYFGFYTNNCEKQSLLLEDRIVEGNDD